MFDQIIVIFVILLSLTLFIEAKLRYDLVALIALLMITLSGIVSAEDAFVGFSHPAVITVVAVLVVSRGLINAGAMEPVTALVSSLSGGIVTKLMVLMGITAFFSSFMNNVGALALTMPIAMTVAKQNDISPSFLLMPVAYASLLGGLVTEIGTPPNLIISMYRQELLGTPFHFFDFAPVGMGLAVVGIIFVGLIGYRLIPNRKSKSDLDTLFKVDDYLSEIIIPEGSKLAGKSLIEFSQLHGLEINILSIIRNKVNIVAPHARETLEARDLLVIKIDPSELTKLIEKTDVILKGAKSRGDYSIKDYALWEIVIKDDSPLIGQTAKTINLRNAYNVNLVAISRQGQQHRERLGETIFKPGDILLLQAADQNIRNVLTRLKGLPLAERGLQINLGIFKKKRILGMGIFLVSIIMTSLGIVPVQLSFTLAAVTMVLFKIMTLKEAYESIEWPVIFMLGAMLPLGEALQSTGAADTIASLLLLTQRVLSPELLVGLLMLVTMLLTNLINNAAAAVLMAPIGISLALGLGVSIDPMLMAVAVGSSCAFMTPIGHQSNTLIMGPGGYHFGDYWKMGLPVTVILLIIGTPLILIFWPL
ncbi:SLC13 family permease [Fusibacter bizertensis]|uniref:SLC13 family permease n=1 Tax=Fusibacter bizertensis TaxID=1488331 RepID=A0ABT6N9I1_9FIRM|nr:SLC13 family permease [Fusibacter bizertensis]MDH8677049.1 SLC13 family permease [Fusibacter bizertensis]